MTERVDAREAEGFFLNDLRKLNDPPRIALEDFELQGNTIREGQIVQLSIASANRDEAHFSNPDAFDISRSLAGT